MIDYIKNKFTESRATVLTYHRIASPVSDIWNFSVDPENFEQQLQVLKKSWKVIPLKQMVESIRKKELKHNRIALTFDDGYADNFSVAKPLLELYEMPATFFITTGKLDHNKVYWWDELEQLILFQEQLPQKLKLTVNFSIFDFDLGIESVLTEYLRYKHANWKVSFLEEPPTKRAQLYLQLWRAIRPLSPNEQNSILKTLKKWAKLKPDVSLGYGCMTPDQVSELAGHELFDIGAHSVTHPVLSYFPKPFQKREILESRRDLENLTRQPVKFFAYPYGDYNENMREILNLENFNAGFTNEEEYLDEDIPLTRLPRFQVKNWNGKKFGKKFQMKQMINV